MVIARLGDREFRIAKQDITIQGRPNVYNAMAAILASLKAEVSDEELRKGLMTFPQVEHRLETVDVVNGVTYINDSKATNVDSAWYALDSMHAPVVWIAGGTDKGNDYSVLFDLVKEKVKLLICMGVENKKLLMLSPRFARWLTRIVLTRRWTWPTVGLRVGTWYYFLLVVQVLTFSKLRERGELFKLKVKSLKIKVESSL